MEQRRNLVAFFCLALLGLSGCEGGGGEKPVVSISQGSLQGSVLTSRGGRPIYAFQGIPYAEPPLGDLRFKHPQEKRPWSSTFDATRSGVQCLQDEVLRDQQVGEEDCLVLNVYSNELPHDVDKDDKKEEQPSKPVMVFIHGGGFVAGDGTTRFYGPSYLLDEDVVLVTMNYRLGALGFFTLGDDVLPPNLGLWDQVLALKWVQKNIRSFGGDPNQVTIFGESAGSMSTMLHVLSPQSAGLFHSAIAQSGVPSTSFMFSDKHPAYYARTLAGRLGCNPKGTSAEIRSCVMKVDARKLMDESKLFTKYDILPTYFKPIVDGNFSSKPFLPKEPLEMIEEGSFNHVPLVIGCNKDEGILLGGHFVKQAQSLERLNGDWDRSMAFILFHRDADEVSDRELEISREVLARDFGGKKPTAESGVLDTLSTLYGDAAFFVPSVTIAAKMAEKSSQPVYHYLYTHQGTVSLVNFFVLPTWKLGIRALGRMLFGLDIFRTSLGVCHADELFLLFRAESLPYEATYTDEDKQTSANLVKLWTNFARWKDPTPKAQEFNGVAWKRVDPKSPKVMKIGPELTFGPLSKDEKARVKRWQDYWKEIFPKMHLPRSASWKHPGMFDKKRVKDDHSNKEEL